MGVIYPAGSIIGRKKDNKKFCIIEIAKDGYYVADYPIGVQLVGQKEFLKDDEVGSLFFWGYMNENYKKELFQLLTKKDVEVE